MSENRLRNVLAVALSLIVFCAGLIYFGRFSSARSYPPYSSLNSQKNGAKLLFAALAGTRKLSVNRNYLPPALLHVEHSAILFLGVTPTAALQWTDADLSNLERLARAGNRLAIAFTEERMDWKQLANHKSPLQSRWKLPIEPGSSPLRLHAGDGWKFEDNAHDILGENFGDGSVSFLPHAERLTNKPLSESPGQTVLPLLIGPYTSVIFDESHLGIEETGSVAGLARRYHLQGFAGGLLLLAVLFIWKQSVHFTPTPRDQIEANSESIPRSTQAILGSLLSENISRSDLIPLCVEEWNRFQPKRLVCLDEVTSEDPVEAYRQIQQQLTQRKSIRA